jgi:cytochrome c biogenesis protein
MGWKSIWNKVYQTLASVRTGIFLIIVVGIFSAIGTVILQRPTSEPEDMQRAYSPETLLWLDRLTLTDIFHAWWFLLLLSLFCLCLIFVSVDRWPNAWKVYAKPIRFAEPSFRVSLPQTVKIAVAVKDDARALSVAEQVLSRFGFKPERVTQGGATGLYAERQRYSVFALYLVHLSLICIFAGYIVDGIVGYRGNINVPEGQALGQITLRDNKGGETKKTLPFLIRCDGAGEETYADGSPKKWWSKLTLIENGKEAISKTIVVNDPFVYKGIRIYQSSMGQSSTPRTLTFAATPSKGGAPETVEVPLNGKVALADGESLSVLRWVPDYYVQDNQVYKKSDDVDNPAVQLGLTNASGETKKLWILYSQANNTTGQDAPYGFALKNASWEKYTGLEVSHQPGQFGVWIGVVLIAFGLVIAFYTQHMRIWATVAEDGKGGKLLWMGGTTNKNRDRFQAKFELIKAALQAELGGNAKSAPKSDEKTLTKA